MRDAPASGLTVRLAHHEAREAVRRIVTDHYSRPSRVAEIACEVGAEIIDGALAPGDDLNTVELARRFGSSRTPVREALMLLEKEGLVEIPPWRRPRVASVDMDRLREIYRLRAALYVHIAHDIADRASDDQIASLLPALTEMEASCAVLDTDRYVWANVAFYDCVTQIAANGTAKRILDSLLLRTLPFRRLSLSQPGRMARSLEDHRHLVRAWMMRDGDLAAALLRTNNKQALATLERSLVTSVR